MEEAIPQIETQNNIKSKTKWFESAEVTFMNSAMFVLKTNVR